MFLFAFVFFSFFISFHDRPPFPGKGFPSYLYRGLMYSPMFHGCFFLCGVYLGAVPYKCTVRARLFVSVVFSGVSMYVVGGLF